MSNILGTGIANINGFINDITGYGGSNLESMNANSLTGGVTPEAFQAAYANVGGEGTAALTPADEGNFLSSLLGFGSPAGQATEGADWFGGANGGGGIVGGIASGIGGIGSLMGAINAGKQLKLSKDMYGTQKDIHNQNMQNSISSYNTRLSDRDAARRGTMSQENYQKAYGDNYVADRSLAAKNI